MRVGVRVRVGADCNNCVAGSVLVRLHITEVHGAVLVLARGGTDMSIRVILVYLALVIISDEYSNKL